MGQFLSFPILSTLFPSVFELKLLLFITAAKVYSRPIATLVYSLKESQFAGSIPSNSYSYIRSIFFTPPLFLFELISVQSNAMRKGEKVAIKLKKNILDLCAQPGEVKYWAWLWSTTTKRPTWVNNQPASNSRGFCKKKRHCTSKKSSLPKLKTM